MGNSISEAIKRQQDAHDAEVTETLTMMHKMLINKISAESSQMENAAIEDKSLPIVAVVDKTEKYKIDVSSVTSDEVASAIDDVMSGDFLDGIKKLVKVGLDQLLGNVSAGETERKDFHVVFANNSLLRIDYMMYRYNFSSKGIKDEVKNCFCYYLQIGVLDLQKVNPQILLYELTRAIGETKLADAEKRLENLATFAKDLYKIINELDKAAVGALVPGGPSGFLLSEDEKETARKRAILARYHRHKHATFVEAPGPQPPAE